MSSLAPGLDTGLKIVPSPEKVYLEKSRASQLLNCDFIVENASAEKWRLKQIEISVFDPAGKLVTRRFIDESGGIQTIPNRELDSHSSELIFNPFFSFDHHLELRELRYRFTFACAANEGGDDQEEVEKTVETTLTPEYYDTRTRLGLPVEGRALIWDTHDFYSHHRRFNYYHPMLRHFGFKTNFQRYGYDFVPVNDSGEMFRGDDQNNEDWFGFGRPVLAVADGVVADLFDGMPDDRAFDQAEIGTREMVVFGNYVILDHQNGEYSCLAHLKQESITVRKGQEVKQGQILGQIGASGGSLFPHLHYELRNGMGAKDVDGLPSYFSQFRRILGSHSIDIDTGQIDTGKLVEQITAP